MHFLCLSRILVTQTSGWRIGSPVSARQRAGTTRRMARTPIHEAITAPSVPSATPQKTYTVSTLVTCSIWIIFSVVLRCFCRIFLFPLFSFHYFLFTFGCCHKGQLPSKTSNKRGKRGMGDRSRFFWPRSFFHYLVLVYFPLLFLSSTYFLCPFFCRSLQGRSGPTITRSLAVLNQGQGVSWNIGPQTLLILSAHIDRSYYFVLFLDLQVYFFPCYKSISRDHNDSLFFYLYFFLSDQLPFCLDFFPGPGHG